MCRATWRGNNRVFWKKAFNYYKIIINTLIQFCSPVGHLIFVVEDDSGVDIPDKTGLKELNNMTSRRMHPHMDIVVLFIYIYIYMEYSRSDVLDCLPR